MDSTINNPDAFIAAARACIKESRDLERQGLPLERHVIDAVQEVRQLLSNVLSSDGQASTAPARPPPQPSRINKLVDEIIAFNVKSRLKAFTDEYERGARRKPLHELAVSGLPTDIRSMSEDTYVGNLLEIGRRQAAYDQNSQFFKLQGRLYDAIRLDIYRSAVKDVENNHEKESPFIRCTNDRIRRQFQKPPEDVLPTRTTGHRAESEVLDRLVLVCFHAQQRPENVSPRQFEKSKRKRMEGWLNRGKIWHELVRRFGVDILMLIPPDHPDSQWVNPGARFCGQAANVDFVQLQVQLDGRVIFSQRLGLAGVRVRAQVETCGDVHAEGNARRAIQRRAGLSSLSIGAQHDDRGRRVSCMRFRDRRFG